jgi:putative colanic acid biosynthesis acetyltransferase WcaF
MRSSPGHPYLGQGCVTPYGKRELVLRWTWSLVQATLFRWSPRPCHAFRAYLLRLFGADVTHPRQVVIFPTASITFPWRLRLEPRAMIGPGVRIYNLGSVTVEFGANVSQYCHLCAGTHDHQRWDMPLVTHPITIGRNAWLGTEVFVGPGVTIGELAVIGARSVVIKDQPARMVCAGHPCKPLKPRPDPQ